MKTDQDYFRNLTGYAKRLAALTPEREALLIGIGPELMPHLPEITEDFYKELLQLPTAQPFLEGRVDTLKETHLRWMQSLFSGPFDENFTQAMYRVGYAHVRVNLPIEFMAGGTALVSDRLLEQAHQLYAADPPQYHRTVGAINAVLSFCLLVMQDSYQSSTLAEELDKFLKITGMSRALFNNLAAAYRDAA